MKGGARKGAGRKKGATAATKARVQLAQRVAAEGVTPLEIMTRAMNHFQSQAYANPDSPNIGKMMQAVAMAEKVAPYIHPRLTAVKTELTGKDGTVLPPSVVTVYIPCNGRDVPGAAEAGSAG